MDFICQGQNGAIKWKLMKVSEVPFKRVMVLFSPRDWLRDLFSYHFAMKKITNKLFNVTCIDEQMFLIDLCLSGPICQILASDC